MRKFSFPNIFVKINTLNIMNQPALLTDELISNHDIANEFGVNGNKSDRIHYLCFYNTNFLWDMNKNLQNNGIQNGKRKELSAWYENNHSCFEQRKKNGLFKRVHFYCLSVYLFLYVYIWFFFWLVLSLSLSFLFWLLCLFVLTEKSFRFDMAAIFFPFCRVSFRI